LAECFEYFLINLVSLLNQHKTHKMKQTIINAQIILRDQILKSEAIVLEDGYIVSIAPASVSGTNILDLKGAYLLSGFIDLHCDAIEGVIEPRIGVHFPLDFGIAQMDRINAMAGITTSFNSISFASDEFGVRGLNMASNIVKAIKEQTGKSLVDNRIHCRYEITDPETLPVILELIDNDQIDILSFMDHTPGQGQFKQTIDYVNYQRSNYHISLKEIESHLEKKNENRRASAQRITQICEYARKRSIFLLSHDDDTPQRVSELKRLGVTISEFPINLETAIEAKKQGMTTIFGAPNTLRGKSQSGSIKAIEAIEKKVADCLCSDYFPSSLMSAVFKLPDLLDITLCEAINMATLNPANSVGLTDRGEIEVGQVADLVSVQKIGDQHQVTSTWSRGEQVFVANYNL